MHLIEYANGIIDLESALFSVAIRMDYHLFKSFLIYMFPHDLAL